MLQTNLKRLETDKETQEAFKKQRECSHLLCPDRPVCIPVYAIVSHLETRYPHLRFYDQDFDIPAARFIRRIP